MARCGAFTVFFPLKAKPRWMGPYVLIYYGGMPTYLNKPLLDPEIATKTVVGNFGCL